MIRSWSIVVTGILLALCLAFLLKDRMMSVQYSMIDSLRPVRFDLTLAVNEGAVSINDIDVGSMIRFCHYVRTVSPKDPMVEALLAFYYFHLKQYQKAFHYYTLASVKNPSSFWLKFGLGVSAIKLGKLDQARVFLIEAQQLNPEDAIKPMIESRLFANMAYGHQYSWLERHLKQAYMMVSILLAQQDLTQVHLPDNFPLF